MRYLISDIAEIVGNENSHLARPLSEVDTLLIDSRSPVNEATTLFFAISTRNDDGHHYVPELYNRGVRNFVVERVDSLMIKAMPEANFLCVGNAVDALQSLAKYHRRRFDIPVIAITGSQGKTTVKEWLNTLLSDDYKIVRSPRSYNSQIGVPLSLWEIDDKTTLAIIEAGISTVGEMNNLQDMIRPTIGIITNLGSEHNDGFASMSEKAAEKAKILTNCDLVVYPGDDSLVTSTIAPLLDAHVADEISWGTRSDAQSGKPAILLKTRQKSDAGCCLTYVYKGEEHELSLPLGGDSDVENVMCCLAVMLHFGISPEEIARRAQRLKLVETRLNVVEGVNNSTIVVDGYTSDYNSLSPALDFTLRRRGVNRPMTIILSDLRDDGMDVVERYIRVSELLKNKGVTRLIGVGEDMCRYGKYFSGIATHFYHDTSALLEDLSPGDFVGEIILVKGAPEFDFDQIIDVLEARRHETVEEIDLNALAHNFKFFRSRLKPETRTVAMVKASGYGTGSFEIAKTLQDCGADYLAVAVQDEGVDLRRAGITMPIIVLNPSGANYKAMFVNNLEPEVYSVEECRALIREGERQGVHDFPIHVKIDTGMHRLGFTLEQLPALLKLLSRQNVITPVSIFSHLCVADEPGQDDYTRSQLDCFERCAAVVQASFSHHIKRHILNTAGTIRFGDYQMDMVRVGIGLYGIHILNDGSEDSLRPVASLHSIIISLKDWKEGTTIGYGRHGVITKPSTIATVTMGYADGLDRHFGRGKVSFWVNGHLCPTVGNICMDACMIDVTGVECKVGDRVEIFGPHVPIEQLSAARDTIPYEILTSISPRVKRVYFRD